MVNNIIIKENSTSANNNSSLTQGVGDLPSNRKVVHFTKYILKIIRINKL